MDYYIYWTITGKHPRRTTFNGRVNCICCGKWTTDQSGICWECRERAKATMDDIKKANERNKKIYGSYEEENK